MASRGISADSYDDRTLEIGDELQGRSYPDDREIDAIQLSFQEFCDKARALFLALQDASSEQEEKAAAKAFYRFVLAGRTYSDDHIPKHITVNACQGLSSGTDYSVTRDFDSLIGYSKDLPYTQHVELSPIPPFRFTLTTHNHMLGLAYSHGEETWIPMYKIPNFAFGKIATRSVIRVFLPRMFQSGQSRAIPTQDLEVIYDHCLRPLVVEHLGTMASHWPISYSGALDLYRDKKGQIHQGSLDVPEMLLDVFGRQYLERLGQLRPYFRDAYFVHELRGWKAATVHDPSDHQDRTLALEKFTECLDLEKLYPNDWFVDVALEFGKPGHVTTWQDQGHLSALQHCLPSLEEDDLRVLLRSKKFYVDQAMHLLDLTGFRCSPGKKGRDDDVTYIQAYTTEKSVSYQLHEGLFSVVKPSSLLTSEGLEDVIKRMERMSSIIFQCTGAQDSSSGDGSIPPQDGCARIEVRVSIANVDTTLISVPNGILENSILSIPSATWWLFKWYRLAAVHMVIKNLHHSNVRNRRSDCAIGLGGIMIWLLNGLFRRPEDNYKKLAEEACQHVPLDYEQYDPAEDQDDPDAITPLMYDAGLYFICDIVVDDSGTFRLPYHKAISDDAIQQTFHLSLDKAREVLGIASHTLSRSLKNTERTANRSKQATLHVDDFRPQDRQLPTVNEDFLQNIRTRPTQNMKGPDIRHFARHGGGNRDAETLLQGVGDDEESIVRRVQVILEQFFHDVIMESPNHRDAGKGAWTNIPSNQRAQEATQALFQSTMLPFFSVKFTFCTKEHWDTHFDRLFPLQRSKAMRQNLPKCTYYKSWLGLLDNLTPSSRSRVRAAVKEKFNALAWVPFTATDRMWTTRQTTNSRAWFSLPKGEPPAGPQIAINPWYRKLGFPHPTLRPAPADHQTFAEEEEESSDRDNFTRTQHQGEDFARYTNAPSRQASSKRARTHNQDGDYGYTYSNSVTKLALPKRAKWSMKRDESWQPTLHTFFSKSTPSRSSKKIVDCGLIELTSSSEVETRHLPRAGDKIEPIDLVSDSDCSKKPLTPLKNKRKLSSTSKEVIDLVSDSDNSDSEYTWCMPKVDILLANQMVKELSPTCPEVIDLISDSGDSESENPWRFPKSDISVANQMFEEFIKGWPKFLGNVLKEEEEESSSSKSSSY